MKATFLLFAPFFFCVVSYAQQMKPEETEVWEPVPVIVMPGTGSNAPSDAIILFDGKNLDHWISGNKGPAKWELKDGAMTVVKGTGSIKTKELFGDCQLHIEWRTPSVVEGDSQGRGNSGIFLQDRYEVQVLDSYNNRTYSNGQAGSIYKQHIPLVNACLPPGEWQSYDIIYEAPVFSPDGKVESPAFITVIHNGVLIQNHVQIKGGTTFIGLPEYESHGDAPLQLQDHGNPVSYRNIWIRKL